MTATPRVAFRADAGSDIGLGHARRCLTLAGALRELGVECFFVFAGDRAAREWLAASDFDVVSMESARDLAGALEHPRVRQARVFVVDSPSLGTADLARLAAAGQRVVVIDDLADHALPVDLVVNASAGAERLQYRGAPRTRFLLGPRYALLRRQFVQAGARSVSERARRILVTVGGGDPEDFTSRLVEWAVRALGAVEQDVVVGPFSGRSEALRRAVDAAGGRVALHEDPKDIASLMLAADVALCGGGQTVYELAATGTPALAIRLAENQTLNLTALAEAGTLAWVGDAGDADLEAKIGRALAGLADDPTRRARMSRQGRALVDGRGAGRVARVVADLGAAG
ncbi:MAG: UDP-2,4-diacetamido-2,4,6-trideoxy-beta-L-altropyranose hydrolase [Candidatus Rokuibacteriota bacterium]|nr:MAG: UDP-2,4-diacetamido-2,4,6-trideoxy-beta-L-altropyranose hydrolase [Candidatus Rokubacteria bacterium]